MSWVCRLFDQFISYNMIHLTNSIVINLNAGKVSLTRIIHDHSFFRTLRFLWQRTAKPRFQLPLTLTSTFVLHSSFKVVHILTGYFVICVTLHGFEIPLGRVTSNLLCRRPPWAITLLQAADWSDRLLLLLFQ